MYGWMDGWMDGWVLSVLGAVLHVSRGGVVSHTQRFSRFLENNLFIQMNLTGPQFLEKFLVGPMRVS